MQPYWILDVRDSLPNPAIGYDESGITPRSQVDADPISGRLWTSACCVTGPVRSPGTRRSSRPEVQSAAKKAKGDQAFPWRGLSVSRRAARLEAAGEPEGEA